MTPGAEPVPMCLRVMATKARGGEEEGKRAPDSERLRNPSCQGLLFHGLVSRRNKLLDKPVGGCNGWFSIGGHVRVFFVARDSESYCFAVWASTSGGIGTA